MTDIIYDWDACRPKCPHCGSDSFEFALYRGRDVIGCCDCIDAKTFEEIVEEKEYERDEARYRSERL